MPQTCPVCETVNENRAECSSCGWDLTPPNRETILKKLQNDQNWAKKALKRIQGLQEVPEKIDYLTQLINELLQPKNSPLSRPNLEENQQVLNLTEQIEQLQSQVQELAEKVQKLQTENNSLKDRVKKLENNQVIPQDRVRESQNNPVTQFRPEMVSLEQAIYTEPYNTSLTFPEKEIVRQYNSDSLSGEVIKVEVTTDSLNKRYIDINQPLELERENSGDYRIIGKDDSYYLFPKNNLRIFGDRYLGSTKILFECLNYQEGITKSWQLLKPAKVSQVGEIWQLKERGVLQFS